jgi:glycosyltransferase involved in cell wall biosynthesis
MRHLVWLSEVPFAGSPHRQVHLARSLAEWFEVLFVEPPAPRRAPRTGITQVDGIKVAQVAPLLNARPGPLRAMLRLPAARRLASEYGLYQVQRRLRAVGWGPHARPLTLISSNVFLTHAFTGLKAEMRVLDICDDPRFYPGEPPWTAQLLRHAVRRADVAVTSSLALQADFTRMGAQRVTYLPNGIAPELLRALPRPVAVGEPRRPVLGFLGHLGSWVDFELLADLARALPGAELMLVGSIDPDRVAALAALQRLPNVTYTGRVSYEAIGRTIASFDVGLIPFCLSDYTRAVNPLKLYEYAAQDVPIVTTAFSPDVRQFGNCVRVADSYAAFVAAAQAALRPEDCEPVRWIAEQHTWPALAARYADILGVNRSRI